MLLKRGTIFFLCCLWGVLSIAGPFFDRIWLQHISLHALQRLLFSITWYTGNRLVQVTDHRSMQRLQEDFSHKINVCGLTMHSHETLAVGKHQEWSSYMILSLSGIWQVCSYAQQGRKGTLKWTSVQRRGLLITPANDRRSGCVRYPKSQKPAGQQKSADGKD